MNGLFAIAKKELARFFRDRRMVLTTLLMPGLLIYAVYSFMGSGMENLIGGGDDSPYRIYTEGMPESFAPYAALLEEETEAVSYDTVEEALDALERGECDLVVSFPADFDERIADYLATGEGNVTAPTLYYYGTESRSSAAFETVMLALGSMESTLNPPMLDMSAVSADLSSKEDIASLLFSSMIPMLILVMLFSGCIAVAPESIAGEKERGTIATLLATPLDRSHLALGKILSLSLIALLCGISSMAGVVLSLPKLLGSEMADGMTFSMYGIGDLFALFGIVLSSVLVIVAMVSVISAYSRSVKEATTYVSPLMIIVVVIGVSGMMMPDELALPMYMIPLFNSSNCLTAIFEGNYLLSEILVTVGSNIAFTGLFAYLLTRMFNSEKIMFKM